MGAIPVAGSLISLHQMKSSTPPRLIEEVNDDVSDEGNPVDDARPLILVFRSNKRPVDEERAPHDVGAGDESPIAAVEADGTVIAHGKIAARRHYQVAIVNVTG